MNFIIRCNIHLVYLYVLHHLSPFNTLIWRILLAKHTFLHPPRVNSYPLHHLQSWHISGINTRADYWFAPSQWGKLLQSNAVSHWLGANPESGDLRNLTDRGRMCQYISRWHRSMDNVAYSNHMPVPFITDNSRECYFYWLSLIKGAGDTYFQFAKDDVWWNFTAPNQPIAMDDWSRYTSRYPAR